MYCYFTCTKCSIASEARVTCTCEASECILTSSISRTDIRITFINICKLIVIYIFKDDTQGTRLIVPEQFVPFPVNPMRHLHSKLPIVSVHSALTSQSFRVELEHSSMSSMNQTKIIQNKQQKQLQHSIKMYLILWCHSYFGSQFHSQKIHQNIHR